MRHIILCFLLFWTGLSYAANVDPTMPFTGTLMVTKAAALKPGEFYVQSIIVSPERNVAIVNGKSVQVGDKLDDYQVSDIKEYQVILTRAGETKTLELGSTILKETESDIP